MEGDLGVLAQGDVGAPGEDLTAGNTTGCPHGGPPVVVACVLVTSLTSCFLLEGGGAAHARPGLR